MPETVELILRARNELSQEVRRATADMERFARTPAAVASGFLRLGSQLGMTLFGLQQLGRTVSGLGGLFSFNARMEQTSVAFTTLLGSAQRATEVLGDLQRFAARTPFEFPELAQSVRLMSAFGFEADKLLPTLEAVGDAVSALGGGSFELQRVVLALGQMAAKGRVSAEEMLQLTEVGIPAWDILAEKVGVSTAELQRMTERGLIPANQAIGMLVEGMGERFAGAMEAQSQTFTGLMSTLRDNVNMALGEIMAPAFEVAKVQLEELVAFLDSPAFQSWAEEMAQGAEDLALEVSTFLREQGPNLLRLAGDLAKAGIDLAGAVASLANELNRLNDAMGGRGLEMLLAAWAANKATGGAVSGLASGAATGATTALLGRLLGGGAAAAGGGSAAAAGGAAAGIGLGTLALGGLAAALGAGLFFGGRSGAKRLGVENEALANTIAGIGVAIPIVGAGLSAYAAVDELGLERTLKLLRIIPDVELAVKQETVAVDEAARAFSHWRLEQENTVNVIQKANAETLLQIEYFNDLEDATDAVASAQNALAAAYQAAGDVQELFAKQGNEYRSNLNAIEEAIAAIEAKQEAGIPLSEQEAQLLARRNELMARLEGGMQDAAIQAGLLAAAQTELMLAQDELNRLHEQGITTGEDYEAALQRVQAAQANYNALLPPGAQMLGELHEVNQELSRVITEELVPALRDLRTNLEQLPKDPITIQIALATEEAERQLEELKAAVRSGAILPVSLSGPSAGGVGPGAGKFQHGGRVPRNMVALVGEAGPELVVLPAGAEVIPAHRTQAILSSLPFAGAFQSGGIVGGGIPTADIQVTLASITAAIPALSQEQAEQVRRASEAYASAIRTLSDAIELARAVARGPIALPDGILSQLAGLAQEALSAVRAADPGLAEQAVESLGRFAGAARSAIDVINDTARLIGDLATAPAISDRAVLEEQISNLKFLVEHLVTSLGDTAAAVQSSRGAGFLPVLEAFAQAAGPALQAIGDMAEVTSSLLSIPRFDDARLRQRITDLKFLLEHLALSLGDTAQTITAARSSAFTESLQSFSQAVGPAIRAASDTLGLVESLSAAVFIDPDTVRERINQVGAVLAAVVSGLAEQSAGLSGEQVETLGTFAEAAQGAIRSEIAALDLVGRLTEMSAIRPEQLQRRAQLLAQTIELVATDLSVATDRLLQEQPEIVERLATFNEGIAPALSGLSGLVEVFAMLRGQGRITQQHAQRFSENLMVAVEAIRGSVGALEELEASGDLATFERVISRLARAFERAFSTFGQASGRSGASSAGVSESGAGVGSRAPVYVNVQIDGQTVRRTVLDTMAGQVRTVR